MVGPKPAAAVQVFARFRPSKVAAFAALILPPKSCAAGCCCVRNNPRNPPRLRPGNHRAGEAVTLVADLPKEDADIFFF